jgi:flagellar biosynthesis GTPase FlhF
MIIKKIEADTMSSALFRAKELFGSETKIHRTASLDNGRFQIIASANSLVSKPIEEKLPTKEKFLAGENFAEEFLSSSDSVLQLKDEILEMKDFISTSLSTFSKSNETSSWGIEAKLHPAQPEAIAMLLNNGINYKDAKELSINLPRNINFAKKTVFDRIISKLSIKDGLSPGIHCFSGPTGSGKTSVMIKIAITLLQQKEKVCFVLGESNSPGAYEELEATASILGIDMFSKNRDVPRNVYNYVLLDNPSNKALLSTKTKKHLMLSATLNPEIYAKYINDGIEYDSVIFTKIDELEKIGFQVLFSNKINTQVLFMNNSPDLSIPLLIPTTSLISKMINTGGCIDEATVNNIANGVSNES